MTGLPNYAPASVAEANANGQGKPTNPKDAIGSTKLALELVPQTAIAYESVAFLEGACKYGRYNWRAGGVRASIYAAAAMRHFFKWWNGEDVDPDTQVHHLASVRACFAIILDAYECGKLTDDRPLRAPLGALITRLEGVAKHVRALFATHTPKQWTLADDVGSFADAMAHTAAAQAPTKRAELAALVGIDVTLDANAAWRAVDKVLFAKPAAWFALDRALGVTTANDLDAYHSKLPTMSESEREFRAAWGAP